MSTNSKVTSLGSEIISRLFFYLIVGLLSGSILWILEGLERSISLNSKFVQPGEKYLFWCYFVFSALGGPIWGLFLGINSSIRLLISNLFTTQNDIKLAKWRIPGALRGFVAGLIGIFLFYCLLSLIVPNYFSNPLYGMFAGATDKIKILRQFFGHRKIAMLSILSGLSILFCLFDILATTFLMPQISATKDSTIIDRLQSFLSSRTFSYLIVIIATFIVAICYFADANFLVTRRDLSFHVPMYMVTLIASLLVSMAIYRIFTTTQFAKILLALIFVTITGSTILVIKHYDTNQNLKSLFWRRGVVAKRYLTFTDRLFNWQAREFNLLVTPINQAQNLDKEANLLPISAKETTPSKTNATNSSTDDDADDLPATSLPTNIAATDMKKPIRNVIFLSIDTLRADHMSIYGYQRQTTPNLDRFAQESILCQRGFSSGTNTGHSFSSIMRSALGDGIFDNEIPTMTKIFGEHGYQTAFITSPKTKAWLAKERWFEYKKIMLKDFQEIAHKEAKFWNAPEMTEKSIEMLTRLKEKGPFFAWIHYTDPHGPYEYHPECAYGSSEMDIYDGEIRYTDIHIEKLLQYLKTSGLMENTMIIFTSDHGEGFNEHGAWEHGGLPYIEQNFVPLWVYYPGVKPQQLSIPLSHIDIAPTMLSFAEILSPTQFEGSDIVKVAKGEVTPKPHIVTETPRNIPEGTFFAWALTDGDWKIIYDRIGNNWQLYNLKNDLTEQKNLADIEAAKFAEMKRKLAAFLNRQAARKNYSQWKLFEFRLGA